MSSHSRITTFVICAVVFLALVFGARGIARDLAAPFEGLEQFAKSRGEAAPEPVNEFQEPVRNIDWDAPAYVAPAPRAKFKVKSIPTLDFSRAQRIDAGEVLVEISLRHLAEVEFTPLRVALVLKVGEPDLESLSTQLNLTESQKAMVAALLEWRKGSIDALTQANGDEDSKERINGSFREAVESLLDPDQARKYKESSKPLTDLAVRASLTEVGSLNASQTMRDYIQRVVAERK